MILQRNFQKKKSSDYIFSCDEMALGSLTEIQNQLLIAKDIGYITEKDFDRIAKHTIEVSKTTNGLIKKTKTLISNS